MMIWIDAQMSPSIATWISSIFSVTAVAVRDVGLRNAKDHEIFQAAKKERSIVMTKDSDFVLLLEKVWTATSSALGNMWQYFEPPLKRNPHEYPAQSSRTAELRRKARRNQRT